MSRYVLNSNRQESENLNYEVHEEGCHKFPNPENQIELGDHSNCFSAIKEAKRKKPEWSDDIDGCKICSEACHDE